MKTAITKTRLLHFSPWLLSVSRSITLSFSLLFTANAYSQAELSMGVTYGQPMNEMAKELKSGPISLDYNFAYHFKHTPFILGTSLRWGNYSTVEKNQAYDHGDYQHADADFTVSHNAKAFLGDAKVLMFPNASFTPFAEGAAGLNRFRTTWYAEDPYQYDNCHSAPVLDKGVLSQSWALAYGAGGGFRYTKTDYYFVEVSAMFMNGKNAIYLSEKEETVNTTDDNSNNSRFPSATAVYTQSNTTAANCSDHSNQIPLDMTRIDVHRSATDMLVFRMGFGMLF